MAWLQLHLESSDLLILSTSLLATAVIDNERLNNHEDQHVCMFRGATRRQGEHINEAFGSLIMSSRTQCATL